MSKKKGVSAPAKAVRPARDYPVWFLPLLTAALFFFYAFLFDTGMDGSITAKVLTLCVCAGIMILMFLKKLAGQLSERISVPFLTVAGYVLVCGVSTFYAVSGKFAIKEFVIMLCSFGLFLLVMAAAKPGDKSVRSVASVVAGALGIYSLISIDAASLGWITKVFKAIISPFTSIFQSYGGFETGTRITSIFQNPNTYAGVTALGILLTLYLVLSETVRRRRNYYLVLLSVNALGFLLAFSMGGTAMFALSIVVYLIAAGKGKRIPAFILMLETAVPTLLMAVVSYAGLGQEGAVTVIPLLAAALNAAVLILLDRFAGEKLISFLQNKGKISAILLSILAALLVLYVVLGFLLTGSYTFSPGETLRRSAYPSGGDFTLSTEADTALTLTIESQNDAQTQLHQSTVLYRGNADSARFTVPEDAKVVYFNFTAPDGGRLDSAIVSNGAEEHSLSLKYLLFPEFVANRLQGLLANENAIQRVVFFRDGLRVFARSPIVGSGIGSFENSLFGVQDFYYTTKYVHNHYIQSLADTGIIGFAFFTGSLVLLAVCLFRNRKTDLACFPALCACLAMIAGHSMVEVSFSTEVFQPTAFLVFALIVLNFSTPLRKKALALGTRLGAAAFSCVFAVLLCGNLFAKLIIQSERSFENLETAAGIDFYEKNDYKLTYVVASADYSDNDHLRSQAAIYAGQLRKVRSNSIANELVKYYIKAGKYDDAFDCMEDGIAYTKSQAQSWQAQFINLEYAFSKGYNPTYEKLMKHKDEYVARALSIVESLTELNRTQMDRITLLPRNHMLIGNLYAIQGLESQEEIDALLANRLFSLAYCADIDENGIPDALTASGGSLSATDGGLHVTTGTQVTLQTFYDTEGSYRLDLRCTVPSAVAEITVDGQPLELTVSDGAVSAAAVLPENTEVKNLTVLLTFQADTDISAFTMEKTGA